MNVFDSSALLVFLQNEDGADVVEKALLDGGVCAAANWSEVAQKVIAHDRDWQLSAALLSSYGIEVEPVGRADAEYAASLWFPGKGLSLADRLCLAVGTRMDATIWTADRMWGNAHGVQQIR